MPGQSISLYFGYCINVRDLAEVLGVNEVKASKCPLCGHNTGKKINFCTHCGLKLNGTSCEASDVDVFNVLMAILGPTPRGVTSLLYNGFVCIGYEMAKSNDGVARFDNEPQYKPWKEMLRPLTKYVEKNPLSEKSHLLKAAFFAIGG